MEALPMIEPVKPEITKNQLDFQWNFEACKKYLETITEKYCGLTATEENLPDFEKARREVVRLRTALTKFKADGKRKLKAPSERFAKQCDELIAVVTDVEMPLNSQIEKYEGDRKAKLVDTINREYQAKASAMGLDMRFWDDFQMVPKWFNKTQRWSDTCNAIDTIIKGQLEKQKAVEDAEALAKAKADLCDTTIALMNQMYKLQTPITAEEVFGSCDFSDMSLDAIKTEIEVFANARRKVEEAARKQPEEEPEMANDGPILPSEPSEEPVKENTHETSKKAETNPFNEVNPFEELPAMENPFEEPVQPMTFSDGVPYPREWNIEFSVERDQEGAAEDIVKNFVHAMKNRGIEVKVWRDA